MSSDSRQKGILLIVGLGVTFFVLLGLLLLYWPQPDRRDSGTETLYVVPAELQIRTRPDPGAPVLATVSQGEALELVSAEGSWAKVRLESGEEGWAERNLFEGETQRKARLQKNEQILELPELRGRVTEEAELYAGPGYFYPVTGFLPRGERVTVRTREQDFYAIDFGGSVSWVDVETIELHLGDAPEMTVAASEGTDLEEEEPLDDAEKRPIYEDFADRWEELSSRDREPEAERAGRDREVDSRELRERLEQRRASTSQGPGGDGVWPSVPAGGTEAVPISRPAPNYPSAAQRAGIEGAVLIRAVVEKDGSVSRAQVLKDLPGGLGDAARRAVERWRFRPATYNGEPISVYYTVTVNFSLRG